MKTTQYTIRNIPEQVDRLVRQQAKKTQKSLNAVLLTVLQRGVGVADEPVEYHDLDALAGSWVTDPDFDASQSAFYYVRVIEIPTPRWSTYDAAKLGVAPPEGVDAAI